VFATPILGGQLNVGVLAFVADNSTALNGSLTVASGGLAIMRQGSISQTTIGFGDLYPEAIIRWNSGVNNWMVYGAGDIPVGDYSSTNLANIGIGHVAVDGGGGYTYFNPQTSSGDNPAIALLSVLGNTPPPKVVINEMTTVASAFTGARFVKGEAISGNPLGLRIAAGNVPNLVNLETGGWGKVIVDAGNSTWTTTLANFDTLASLITAFATVANDDWRTRFFKAATATGGATPKNTLEAMAGIARTPWANPTALYGLFDEAYPQPKDGSRRAAPFAPYLAYTPTDFTLSLWFGGGGYCANGNMVFDAEGNMWCGVNWLPGSQSGVRKSIGGGLIKFSPNGTALSPPITGFTGMGVDGIGWGTAVALDKVWVASFNGAVGVHDFQGQPIGRETDIPFAGKTGGLMGVSVAANGDVWIADGTKNQLLYFPGGRVTDGRIVQVEGLHSPFGIAIDAQNRVWVSNSQANTVVRFPADDPSKVETFKVGIGARGVALDSKGNLWVTSLMSPDFPLPNIPAGVSIMQQFALILEALKKNIEEGKTTGIVSMIRPDGTQLASEGFNGGGTVNAPWGIVIDGNDDVFAASGLGRGIVMLAGVGTNGHAPGTKPGDLIHFFQGGSIEIPTIGSIDPAGDLWVANNWKRRPPLIRPVLPQPGAEGRALPSFTESRLR
jgi:hypothetical protein